MRFFLYTTFLFISFSVFSQNSIQFQRLDFSKNVVGDLSSFELQADNSLWMKASSDTNKVALAKASKTDLGASWKINVQMNVNPSNNNNIKYYILSDSANFTKASNAYYVVIGNNADEVSLYSQTANSATKVIDGLDKRLDKDTVKLEVIVSLAKDGKFTLWSKRIDEADYYTEGSAQIKRNYPGTSYLGFLCTYSSKNTNKFIVKEVSIADPEEDDGGGGGEDPETPVTIEEENFSLSAKSFSNGGEAVYVQYKFPGEGYVARIITFDSAGNKIEELANNTTLGKEGRIRLSANYSEGIVIVFAEARTQNGSFIRKKMSIVCGK
jgi:hypothetical protein